MASSDLDTPVLIGGNQGGGSSWTPAQLGADLSLWLKASDSANIFQTITATTAVANNDPVGTWKDRSGDGFDLTAAANDTTRPTYRIDPTNSAICWVQFDGSNDVLRRTVDIGLYGAGQGSIFFAARGNPDSDARIFATGSSSTNDPMYDVQAGQTDSGHLVSDAASLIRDDSRFNITQGGGNPDKIASGAWDNTDRVVGFVDKGNSMNVFINGTEAGGRPLDARSTASMNRTSLGALIRTAPVSFFNARIYEVVVVNRTLTAQEITDLSTYLAQAYNGPANTSPSLARHSASFFFA